MTGSKLKNKVAIITGGAQGIGKATAERFGYEAADVVVWDISEEKAKHCIQELNDKGINTFFLQVDTTKFDEVNSAVQKTINHFGKIDILINCAGITKSATQTELTQEQWKQVIDVNLTGVFNCTKAVAPFMAKNNFGRIVNCASLVGFFGKIGQSNYSATKSGIIGITKVWSRELSKYNITVNAVAPGYIETEDTYALQENILKSIRERIPVGRLGRPEDVANAYLFLVSDEASYITGTILNIDGGYVI